MHKPSLTVEAFVAALAVVACSRSAERIAPVSEPDMKQEPPGAVGPAAQPSAAVQAEAPLTATPAATARAAASAAASATPAEGAAAAATRRRPPKAKPALGAGTEVKPAATGRGAAGGGDQMTCTANGCSPDMKKPH
jgi:hypothetical protein